MELGRAGANISTSSYWTNRLLVEPPPFFLFSSSYCEISPCASHGCANPRPMVPEGTIANSDYIKILYGEFGCLFGPNLFFPMDPYKVFRPNSPPLH